MSGGPAREPIHPAILALQDQEAALGAPEPTLAEQRAGYLATAEALGGPPVAVAEIASLDVAGVPVRAYRGLEAGAAAPLLVWCHGGGWVLGDLDGFDRVGRRLANAGRCVCVSVDYRLAPEHPFPAAIDDARAVLDWAAGAGAALLGADAGRLAVGGDSAGGQVAAAAALRAGAPVAAQLLVYPALDPLMDSDAYREFAGQPMLTGAQMAAFWARYRGARPADDPELDVLRAPLAGAPPARIAVAAHDPLRDDGLRYAAALGSAGVPARTRVSPAMTHGFLRWGGIVDEADAVIGWLTEELRTPVA